MEEVFRRCVFVTRLCLFLFRHKTGIRTHLRLDLATIEEGAQFAEEDVIRTTVADKVVNIGIEVQRLLRTHDSEPAEEVVGQIERPDELRTEGIEVRLFELVQINLERLSVVDHLFHACVIRAEMHEEFGVVIHNRLHRSTELVVGDVHRQTRACGYII